MSQYEVVIHEVAVLHGVTVERLLGRNRSSPLPQARRDACTRLRAMGLSLPAIARQLGRHHATVLNYLRPKKRHPPAIVGNA